MTGISTRRCGKPQIHAPQLSTLSPEFLPRIPLIFFVSVCAAIVFLYTMLSKYLQAAMDLK
jgi:hypothetical protein